MEHLTEVERALWDAAAKATPGPWQAMQPPEANGWWVVTVPNKDGLCDTLDESGDGGFSMQTAQYIATANPTAIRALLTSLDAARAEAERYRAALEKIAGMDDSPCYGGDDPAFGQGYDMAAMSAADEARAALTTAAKEPTR